MSMEASASEWKNFAFYNFALKQRCLFKTISFLQLIFAAFSHIIDILVFLKMAILKMAINFRFCDFFSMSVVVCI
jgi:hypothetical protein